MMTPEDNGGCAAEDCANLAANATTKQPMICLSDI
jgi:hypothetical protein